jgi:sodium-dependent dicarboxylate transporter 2/3/5
MNFSTKQIGLILGPLGFMVLNYGDFISSLNSGAQGMLACAFWMAVWWIFECVPMAVTALLPIVLFPMVGGLSLSETTAAYGHKFIFLFLGGFILALAIEKWNVHQRLALNIIYRLGNKMSFMILGFMVATAFLSMWISNTAAAVMILPVGMAMATYLEKSHGNTNKDFGKALMLGIAYSASIGGMATLIGTPPNMVLAGVIHQTYGMEVSFFHWMLFALPLSFILLMMTWLILTKWAFKLDNDKDKEGKNQVELLLNSLGKLSKPEKWVLLIFAGMALSWSLKSLVFPSVDDAVIAITGALFLFIVPANNKEALLKWEDTVSLPWGILIMFGGGIALASGFEHSGLAAWIGENLLKWKQVPTWVLFIVLIVGVNFLTEITSNLATTAMLLPILASVSGTMDMHPFMLLMGATLSASCAFMLPVATAPNALVFASGYLKVSEMARVGFWLNLISSLLIFLFIQQVLPRIWIF